MCAVWQESLLFLFVSYRDTIAARSRAASRDTLQEMLETLPALTGGTPPFLGSLISTLQSCQARQGESTGREKGRISSAAATCGGEPLMPPEIAYMISTFQGIQETNRQSEESKRRSEETSSQSDSLSETAPTSADAAAAAAAAGKEEISDVTSKESVTLSQVEALVEAKVKALEERLVQYIDTKLNELVRGFKRKAEIDLRQNEEEYSDSIITTMNIVEVHTESEHNPCSSVCVKEE